MTSLFLVHQHVKLSEKEVEEMRNYSRAHGAAVRKRTNLSRNNDGTTWNYAGDYLPETITYFRESECVRTS